MTASPIMSRALASFALALVPALSCENPAEPTAAPFPTAPPVRITEVRLRTASPTLLVGEGVMLWGELRTAVVDAPWPAIAWTNSDTLVADLRTSGPAVASLVGLRAGTVVVTASADGRTDSTRVTILPRPAGTEPLPIIVDDFHVIEYQYPSGTGQWYYAPQLRLRDATGVAAAAVVGMAFELPGFGPLPPCMTDRPITSTALDVFREVYGEYQLSFFRTGVRAEPGLAAATLTIRLGGTDSLVLTTKGPIVSGSLPTTYTGGVGTGCG